MQDSQASGAATDFSANEPPAYRLVIRARIIPEESVPTVSPRSYRPRLALIVAAIAVLFAALTWLGIVLLNTDSPSTAAAREQDRVAEVQSRSVPPDASQAAPPSQPARSSQNAASTTGVEAHPSPAKSVELDAVTATSPVNEVIPEVPRSALNTIRGTVRVAIEVTIDKQGTVIDASSHHRGPSRYFERLSLEAARKWTFTSASTLEPRSMLLRFHYTQKGATARAEPMP